MPVSNVMDISGKKTDKGVSLPEFKLDFDDLQLFFANFAKNSSSVQIVQTLEEGFFDIPV